MLKEEDLSYVIRGCVYEVFKQLGCGFLEKVYESALLEELKIQGVCATSQVPIKVCYKNTIVGKYVADVVVENSVILELKAQQKLLKIHEAQVLNYLKANGTYLSPTMSESHPLVIPAQAGIQGTKPLTVTAGSRPAPG